MKILFDNGVPNAISLSLDGHACVYSREIGWQRFKNGDLIAMAEAGGFDILLTTDKNIRYQQNLSERKIAVIVLGHAQWPILRLHLDMVVTAINAASPGTYLEIAIPTS